MKGCRGIRLQFAVKVYLSRSVRVRLVCPSLPIVPASISCPGNAPDSRDLTAKKTRESEGKKGEPNRKRFDEVEGNK